MSERLSQELSSLKLCLECPVCLSQPESAPIYQCENGHIICNVCHKTLTECPQCRVHLAKIRNLIAENILEASTKPCPFAKHGCVVRLQSENEDEHKKICNFREISCPIVGCNQKLAIGSFGKAHLQDAHFDCVTFSSHEGFFKGRFYLEPLFIVRPIYIRHKDLDFLAVARQVHADKRVYWHLWTYCFAHPDQASKFSCMVKLLGRDGGVLLSHDQQVVSTLKGVDDVINDGDGLIVTKKFGERINFVLIKLN